jgi:hypothetical protein
MIGSPLSRPAILTLLAFLLPSPVLAHGLNVSVEPRAADVSVTVAAYFDDDTVARAAKVVVTENGGGSVAQGMTDDQGKWAFPRPAPGRYRILVDAGNGHRVHANLDIPPDPAAAIVIDTPSHADFTRFPWRGILGGVGSLAIVAGLAWYVRRKRTAPSSLSTS